MSVESEVRSVRSSIGWLCIWLVVTIWIVGAFIEKRLIEANKTLHRIEQKLEAPRG